ncbi:uncharacterized protein LOC127865773 [Dreissena polymorpha]|uniref:Nuclear receptor coactivator 4 N-terminal domain-containing protein n=1 Tax=Dreissena polymorpha TaxID=45954 RepID=A0A9D4LN64_DREPO|nr:uncharacterized protein LOC127865773 [Dreissena polymorpha]XP_052261688.1 uncharacterized protein LOC127865773 [Dreissena polymorpha]KAH3860769.1 hypothetical protein DPMN_023691 [Dreissena polymorpha]
MMHCDRDVGFRTTSNKIEALEQALRQIADAKKQLCRNTAEAKSRIQCDISRQLEALRNREVWLLNQLDVVSSAKEEVLQQQSARLHKTLGVLQSSAHLPEGAGDSSLARNMAKLDMRDLNPEETPYLSFKSDPASLREAILNYGKIDHTSVPPLPSPFMAPDKPAPSLPRHLEEYEDAEHHILYKTVEEISRTRTDTPCVNVSIPKLSTRVEDWLLYPVTSSVSTSTEPSFTFPKLSNNLSDWLHRPVATATSKPVTITTTLTHSVPLAAQSCRPLKGLEGISSDASIANWLHKIKQNPYEEEEDEYDFVDEVSETQTQYSSEGFDDCRPLDGAWFSPPRCFKPSSKPAVTLLTEADKKWLQKPTTQSQDLGVPKIVVNMSRYFNNIRGELDQWLSRATSKNMDHIADETNSVNERLRPHLPSNLSLNSWPQIQHGDGKWLHPQPLPSRSSSASSLSNLSCSSHKDENKWLLHGGKGDSCVPMVYSFLEKHNAEAKKLSWLLSEDKKPSPLTQKSTNPLERFTKENFDPSNWLKSSSNNSAQDVFNGPSPLKKIVDYQKSSPLSTWLLPANSSKWKDPPLL